MDLNVMIKDLIDSGMVENQELGLNLLRSDKVSDEEKRRHIDKFIQDYSSGKVDFFSEEQRNIFAAWTEIYLKTVKYDIKNRVKRI
jgi:hypothetical protein